MENGNRNVRRVAPSDFLTRSEMVKALSMYADAMTDGHNFAKKFAKEVIEPVLPRICKTLGQECDALYLAYAIENALNEALAEVVNKRPTTA